MEVRTVAGEREGRNYPEKARRGEKDRAAGQLFVLYVVDACTGLVDIQLPGPLQALK